MLSLLMTTMTRQSLSQHMSLIPNYGNQISGAKKDKTHEVSDLQNGDVLQYASIGRTTQAQSLSASSVSPQTQNGAQEIRTFARWVKQGQTQEICSNTPSLQNELVCSREHQNVVAGREYDDGVGDERFGEECVEAEPAQSDDGFDAHRPGVDVGAKKDLILQAHSHAHGYNRFQLKGPFQHQQVIKEPGTASTGSWYMPKGTSQSPLRSLHAQELRVLDVQARMLKAQLASRFGLVGQGR